ncbi:hypothetical protein TNCV_3395021 [Trichonephila clavipes]|nr:hypothetical protein TNCV_3395021 [Trichonephila clavipes]
MHNAIIRQPLTAVSPNSNPIIVMLQAEAGFASNHNAVPYRCPCPPFIAPLRFQSRVNEAMDALRIFHSTANGAEWYERAQNDA